VTEVLRFTRIGVEDIEWGLGTFPATLADGRVATFRKLNMGFINAGLPPYNGDLQKALYDGQGYTVFVPPGTYTGPFIIYSNTTLWMDEQAVLKNADGASNHVLRNAGLGAAGNTNIVISGGTLDGNKATTTGNMYGLALDNVVGFAVERLRCQNVRAGGVILSNGTSDGRVLDLTVDTYGTGTLGTGLAIFKDCHRIAAERITVKTGGTGCNGVIVDDGESGDPASKPCTDVTIRTVVTRDVPTPFGLSGSHRVLLDGLNADNVTRLAVILMTVGISPEQTVPTHCTLRNVIATNVTGTGVDGFVLIGQDILLENYSIDTMTGTGRALLIQTEPAGKTQNDVRAVTGRIIANTSTAGLVRVACNAMTRLLVCDLVGQSTGAASIPGVSCTATGTSVDWEFDGLRLPTSVAEPLKFDIAGTLAGLRIHDCVLRDPTTGVNGIQLIGAGITNVDLYDNEISDTGGNMVSGIRNVSATGPVREWNNTVTGNIGARTQGTFADFTTMGGLTVGGPMVTTTTVAAPQSTAQTLSAATDTITAVAETKNLINGTGGSLTMTSAPTIPDGTNGQYIRLINIGAQDIVIQDQNTLPASNLRLTGTSITLTPRDSVLLQYISAVGDWVQVGTLVTVL
jgi:hypothetical protein